MKLNIKELREAYRETQREMALKLGITQTAIYKYELKDTVINEEVVKKLYENYDLEKPVGIVTSFDIGGIDY